MKLEKLIKQEFVERLGINPDANTVSAFARTLFERHQLAKALRDADDSEFMAALKTAAAQKPKMRTTEPAADEPLAQSGKGKK
jgi:hypothetical protein